jgi:hypothetical protein
MSGGNGGGNIDRVSVNQLSDRYNLARSAVYKRMADLGIAREKIGNRAYVNAEQLALLDELHEFIQVGGNIAEFIARKGLKINNSSADAAIEPVDSASGLALTQSDLVSILTAFAAEMTAQMRPPANPLEYYSFLEEATKTGWKLRTSELAQLLNLDPAEINRYSPDFREAGFVFSRAGYRSGGEVAWLVSKG